MKVGPREFESEDMVSAITCLVIAASVTGYAKWKGRTAWHWFLFGLLFFAVTWVSSLIALRLSGVRMAFASEDHVLAAFAGVLTISVTLVILIAVPERPKKHETELPAER